MPLVLGRRQFLQTAALAGTAACSSRAAPDRCRIALLSDTHIAADPEDSFRGFYPHRNLKTACEQVRQAQFDMLLINGDLARQAGHLEDYAALRGFINPLAETMPLAMSLGNHDDRKNARAQMTGRTGELAPVEQKLVSLVDAGPVQLVILDSLMVTNIAAGQLGMKQRDWLRTYLSGPLPKPVIIFVHHNPDSDDDNGLVDASALLSMTAANRKVKALFFGHTHVFKTSESNGLHLVNLPAVGYNFKDGVPVGWIDSNFIGAGVKLQFHAIGGDLQADGKITELAWRRD